MVLPSALDLLADEIIHGRLVGRSDEALPSPAQLGIDGSLHHITRRRFFHRMRDIFVQQPARNVVPNPNLEKLVEKVCMVALARAHAAIRHLADTYPPVLHVNQHVGILPVERDAAHGIDALQQRAHALQVKRSRVAERVAAEKLQSTGQYASNLRGVRAYFLGADVDIDVDVDVDVRGGTLPHWLGHIGRRADELEDAVAPLRAAPAPANHNTYLACAGPS
mmetsp:Transcript_3955/g.11355  ORF Transcript_3955/g.11355 Transcript_3955/m.11355 type:complete len:222 (+) Transcript_3955:691-1356(+)